MGKAKGVAGKREVSTSFWHQKTHTHHRMISNEYPVHFFPKDAIKRTAQGI